MTVETVMRFFANGLWSAVMVKMAVQKGIITKEQYEEITGLNFVEG